MADSDTREHDPHARTNGAVICLIIGLGLTLPWLTGAGVKLYLDAHDRPTLDWSQFINAEILTLIPPTIWWGVPYFVLALIARGLLSLGRENLQQQGLLLMILFILGAVGSGLYVFWLGGALWWGVAYVLLALVAFTRPSLPSQALKSYRARLIFILCGLLGGAIGTVGVFIAAWWEAQVVFYGIFFFPFICAPFMAAGLLVGHLAAPAVDKNVSLD